MYNVCNIVLCVVETPYIVAGRHGGEGATVA